MCPINNGCSKSGDKSNGRCWNHRGKQYANVVVEVVAPVVEAPVEVAAPVVEEKIINSLFSVDEVKDTNIQTKTMSPNELSEKALFHRQKMLEFMPYDDDELIPVEESVVEEVSDKCVPIQLTENLTSFFKKLFDGDSKPLKLNNNIFRESFDANKMAFIIMNIDKLMPNARSSARNMCSLESFFEASTTQKARNKSEWVGSKKVVYNQPNEELNTRYNALHSLSGQAMLREARHVIFKDHYVDVDQINSHPVITKWICDNLGISCPTLTGYISDREAIIKSIIEINPGRTRDDVKKYVLQISYGCGEKKYKFWDGEEEKISVNFNDFITEFRSEIKTIHKSITGSKYFKGFYDINKRIRDEADKKYNYQGSCMSQICQFVENQLLLMFYEYLAENAPKAAQSCILCFDGIMIPKTHYEPQCIVDMNKAYRDLGIPIIVEDKKMDQGFDIDSFGFDEEINYIEALDRQKSSEKSFKNLIMDITRDGSYRRQRGSGVVYEKITPYYYKRSFDEPIDFTNKAFSEKSWYQALQKKDHQEIDFFIKNVAHPNFKWVEIDHNYIGFPNGVYDLKTATFLEGDAIPEGIQVRIMMDTPFVLCDTPLIDSIFSYQEFDDETIEFLYFALGRTLTLLDDHYDFMLMLYGSAGTGKSILLKALMHSFSSDQVGILSATLEDKFGLIELSKAQITICDDIPKNMAKTLERSNFLSMMSRGMVSCPWKNNSAIPVPDWRVPTIIAGNTKLNYKDENGEIVRRSVVIDFPNIIAEKAKDVSMLDRVLKTEFAAFIHKCRSTYLNFCNKYGGSAVSQFMPESVVDSSDALRMDLNICYRFAQDKLDYNDVSTIRKSDMTDAFRDYVKAQFPHSKSNEKLSPNDICRIDDRIKFMQVKVCKSCLSKHKKGCCDEYSRNNRSTREYFENVSIKV